MLAKARKRVAEYVFPKLTAEVNGRRRFVDQPPLITHQDWSREQYENLIRLYDQYRASLLPDRRVILDRYRMVDVAFKVVGIGSVGTRAFVVLLLAEDGDPLILQIKEARKSVLEPFAGKGPYEQHGQRVVEGQRLTQAASDIFLGWFKNERDGIDYYVRQLRDMKYAYDPTGVEPYRLANYGQFCGWNLARAHAKSGRRGRDRRVPGEDRHVRPGDRLVRARLRRAEQPRLRGVPRGRSGGEGRGHARILSHSAPFAAGCGRVPSPPPAGCMAQCGSRQFSETEVSADSPHERPGRPAVGHREDEDVSAGRAGLPVTGDLRLGDAHEQVPAAAPPRGGDRGPDRFCGATAGAEPCRSRRPDRVQ